jgi:hypothetical protein
MHTKFERWGGGFWKTESEIEECQSLILKYFGKFDSGSKEWLPPAYKGEMRDCGQHRNVKKERREPMDV